MVIDAKEYINYMSRINIFTFLFVDQSNLSEF